jgi:hypothetical protein
MHSNLSLRSVVAIARTHTQLRVNSDFLGAKSDVELAKVVRATARSLAVISRGGLAPDVRISRQKVESMLWTLYKAAKAEQAARVEARASVAAELALGEYVYEPGNCFYCGAWSESPVCDC